tara:strand:+ start:1883 stop:2488 length:606 start_codon:yes stop_codon:yes gene_type:complete
MIWKVANQIQKLVPFLILIVLATKQLEAEINNKCSKTGLVENKALCIDTLAIIDEINSDFQTVYSFGNVTEISQPPLIITPKVTVEAPEALSSLQSTAKNLKPAKIMRPLKAKVKPSEKPHLFNVVKVLDEKGSMHLGRCLKKLNLKARERHFSGLSKELETLETLANSSKKQISPIKKLFTQSPSQKDCINYLDFILMAG